MQDDRLVYNDATRSSTLDTMRGLGADWVRVNVMWNRFAPGASSKRRPAFAETDSNAYSRGQMELLDRIVIAIRARGMEPLLTPTAPAPLWASAGGRGPVYKPSPTRFGRFVQALGERYNGRFTPAGGSSALPRVRRWSIYNEPNQPGWLQPQYSAGRPYAPHLYRKIYVASEAALRRTGHRTSRILIGETAPLGDRRRYSRSKMQPGRFISELFCLGSRDRACRSPRTIRTSGFAHHPYAKFRNDTPRTRGSRDEFPFGDLRGLTRLLDRAGRAHRVRRGLSVYNTEYGWQTNPPDRLFGVSQSRQARYLNESEFSSYLMGRVKSYGQYLLRDDPDTDGFQTGLVEIDGDAKPALDAFRTALRLGLRQGRITVWGHLRPESSGTVVELEHAKTSRDPWRRSGGRLKTDGRGYIGTRRNYRSGRWRLVWTDASGATRTSRVASSPRR